MAMTKEQLRQMREKHGLGEYAKNKKGGSMPMNQKQMPVQKHMVGPFRKSAASTGCDLSSR